MLPLFLPPHFLTCAGNMSSLDIPNVDLLPCFLHQADPVMSHITPD